MCGRATASGRRALTSDVVQRDDDSGENLPRVSKGPEAQLLVGPNPWETQM